MTEKGLTATDVKQAFDLDDEVMERLQIYADLLVKWQQKINLVGPDTVPDLWRRHMLDSAQLAPLIADGKKVVDFGSGAGFPALVLACLKPRLDIHLIESDQRKCAFMREVKRAAGLSVTIHTERIEKVENLEADIVTSRALAPLDKLLSFADMHSLSTGIYLFLKGRRWQDELTAAQKDWNMQVHRHPSRSDSAGMILEISDCRPKH
ncbi:16S rRNA (guanine(527)-N(7))-methyltransferase RsmG [Magnetovibrio sp. PR-2]|uniref:16S rRNA (guanine(527)-N(7))-methyltransferase RsmG n=1 Tax=Magnetovibrio sp. PR-2 TaxID=3120356 RepID=UPI002FCE4651